MPKRKKTEGRNSVDLATDFYSNPNANLVSFEHNPTHIPSIRTAEHDRDLDKDVKLGEDAKLYKQIKKGMEPISGLYGGNLTEGQLKPAVEPNNIVFGYGSTIFNRADAISPGGKTIKKGVPVKVTINGKETDINKGKRLSVTQIESKYQENKATATAQAKANVKKWREKGLLNRKWEYLDPKIQNLLIDMSFQLGSKLSRPASKGGWEALPKAIERRDAASIREHLSVKGTKERNKIRRKSLKDLYKM